MENESRLIELATMGDTAAGEQLLALHRPRLEAYLERHFPADLKAEMDVQDILQDVYFQFFRRIGQFQPQGEAAMFRWLATIARNLITDALRRRQSAKRGGGRQICPDGSDRSVVVMLEELAVYRRTPSLSAMGHEMVALLERSIGRLSTDHQTVLRLKYIEGLETDEIASRMNRPAGQIYVLCFRAIQALRVQMSSEAVGV